VNDIKFGWFAVCERVLISEDHNLTLVECLEQISGPEYPASLPRLTFVAYFYRARIGSAADVPVRLVAEPPGRPDVEMLRASVRFDASNLRSRARFVFDGFTFTTHGPYTFRLEADLGDGLREVARLPIIALRPGDPHEGVVSEPPPP
jgi:hypothetical protein